MLQGFKYSIRYSRMGLNFVISFVGFIMYLIGFRSGKDMSESGVQLWETLYFPLISTTVFLQMECGRGKSPPTKIKIWRIRWIFGNVTFYSLKFFCDPISKYQPSGTGGICSTPATTHPVQKPKWLQGAPKLLTNVVASRPRKRRPLVPIRCNC